MTFSSDPRPGRGGAHYGQMADVIAAAGQLGILTDGEQACLEELKAHADWARSAPPPGGRRRAPGMPEGALTADVLPFGGSAQPPGVGKS